jgi:hypothetical protein
MNVVRRSWRRTTRVGRLLARRYRQRTIMLKLPANRIEADNVEIDAIDPNRTSIIISDRLETAEGRL